MYRPAQDDAVVIRAWFDVAAPAFNPSGVRTRPNREEVVSTQASRTVDVYPSEELVAIMAAGNIPVVQIGFVAGGTKKTPGTRMTPRGSES